MKRQPAWVWVVLGLGFCWWGCVGLLGLASLSARTVQTQPQKRTWTRQEFEAMLMGKTKDEVIALVGKPDATIEPGQGNFWRYYNATTDPISGKVDGSADVFFTDDGVVDDILF